MKINWNKINIFSYLLLMFLVLILDNIGIYPKPTQYNLAIAFICGAVICACSYKQKSKEMKKHDRTKQNMASARSRRFRQEQ